MNNSVYDALGLLTLEVFYIAICFVWASYNIYKVFAKIGFGSVGISLFWGFVLVALGFMFIGISSWFTIDFPIDERIAISMVGRLIQAVGGLFIVFGFGRYYDWATGRFTRFDRFRFFRRTNPKARTIEIED